MPQFISLRTQYRGATSTQPGAITAQPGGCFPPSQGRFAPLVQEWDTRLSVAENHRAAATAWANRFAQALRPTAIGPAPLTPTTYQWLIQLEDPK